jgi:hypothetical protein
MDTCHDRKYRPTNALLAGLAAILLADIIAIRPHNAGDFLISVGVLGALVSRAGLADVQPLMVTFLGLVLTIPESGNN